LFSLSNKKAIIAYYGRDKDNKNQWKRNDTRLVKVINVNNNNHTVTIMFHPIFKDDWASFYTLKSLHLYKEIAVFHNTNKVPKAIILFIEWLLTKDEKVVIKKKEIIIERLWLNKLEKHRHNKRINKILENCFVTAKGLGYLIEYSFQEDTNELTFVLNPEKCRRINANKKGKEKKDSTVELIDDLIDFPI
jgi:hypothetical protein